MLKITEWMNFHFLKINPDKTEIILFLPSSHKTVNTINGCRLYGNNCIRFSNTVKNVGVILDKCLNMECYINSIVSHCYKLLRDVGRIRYLLSEKQTEMLVHSIISSRLDYCNSLLYGVNKSVIYKLQKVQNSAARLIVRRRKFDPINDVLKKLHWLKIEERIIFKILLMTFKCLNDMAPQNLIMLIKIKDLEKCLLEDVNFNSVYGRRSFMYIAPRLWNHLPTHIRCSKSINYFKGKIKHMLFINYKGYMSQVFKYQSYN